MTNLCTAYNLGELIHNAVKRLKGMNYYNNDMICLCQVKGYTGLCLTPECKNDCGPRGKTSVVLDTYKKTEGWVFL